MGIPFIPPFVEPFGEHVVDSSTYIHAPIELINSIIAVIEKLQDDGYEDIAIYQILEQVFPYLNFHSDLRLEIDLAVYDYIGSYFRIDHGFPEVNDEITIDGVKMVVVSTYFYTFDCVLL
jgi:hypothetical protein